MKKTAFGSTVKRLRLIYEMTLQEASDKSGIHSTKFSELESGKRVPSASDMEKLAQLFGVKVETILTLSKELEEIDSKSERVRKAMFEALIKFFADCKEVD